MYSKIIKTKQTQLRKRLGLSLQVRKTKKEMKSLYLLKEFCDATSLHGWFFYAGSSSDKKCSWSGCFWFTILVASMSAAIFVMGTTIQEFREATVRYSLESATVPLSEVYFPSMTICNMNTLRRSFIYSLVQDDSLKAINVTFNELQKIVHLIFIAGEDYQLSEREKVIVEIMFSSVTYSNMFKELLNNVEVGVISKDWCEVPIQKWHVLQDAEINSTEDEAKYSRAYVTELASQFRDEEFISRIQLKGSGIQFQVGFSTDVSESCVWVTPFIKPSDDMSDVRTVQPFAKNSLPNGMQLLIDVEAFDYAVSSTGSEGLILSILHQLDIPIMKNIGINVQPGQDVQIAVTPTLITTNKETKRRFEPVRRQCYFEDEITLFHFPVEDGYRYEMSNCLFEATLQEIEKICNCTLKYYVDIADGYEACEGRQRKCMNQLMVEMGDKREVVDRGRLLPCLAACIDQTHKLLVTQASYPNEDSFVGTTNFCLLLRKLVKSCNGDRRQVLDIKNPDLCPAIEAEPKATSNLDCFNTTTTEQLDTLTLTKKLQSEVFNYARTNLAKVSVYIKDPYVSKYITEEKITEIAFVGTVGGILGLFLGFSFISAVEIGYVFCFKYFNQKCSKPNQW